MRSSLLGRSPCRGGKRRACIFTTTTVLHSQTRRTVVSRLAMQSDIAADRAEAPPLSTNAVAPRKRRCAGFATRLLGPSRPYVGSHTVAEAGGSIWLPTEALLLFRLACTAALLFTLVLYLAARVFRAYMFGTWTYTLATLSMLCSTLSSLSYLVRPERAPGASTGRMYALLADVCVPLSQAGLTASATVTVLYWTLLAGTERAPREAVVLPYVVAPLMQALDAALASRMGFRQSYVVIVPALGAVWLGVAWVRQAAVKDWSYAVWDLRRWGTGKLVGLHVGFVAGGAVIGIAVLALNRLNAPKGVKMRLTRRWADERTASIATTDAEGEAQEALEHIIVRNASGDMTAFGAPLPLYDSTGSDLEQPRQATGTR